MPRDPTLPPLAALHFGTALLPSGWASDVRIEHAQGLIADIEVDVPARAGDERASVAVPGLPNLHSHAFQRGMAGLSEYPGPRPDSFWTWRELMYRFVAQITPDALEALAAQAYVEMLESGFTRVGEFHYLHHAESGAPYADPVEMSTRIGAAAQQTGIALTLLPVFYAHGGFGGADPAPEQRRFVHDLDGYARLFEGCRALAARLEHGIAGVAPHSLRAVTQGELLAVIALAEQAPVHIHVAEQLAEVQACEAWSGQRPVAWLLDHAAVDARFCLVHATHVDAREIERMADSQAVVGLCPITEANLGDGVFPAVELRQARGQWGVGSDSNVLISASEELRLLEYGQRLTRRARNLLADPGKSVGRTLFESALTGGARALGAPLAGLCPGAPADIVSLAIDSPSLAAHSGDRLLDAWIFAAGPSQGGVVDCVWRAGRKVVQGGRHVDRAAVSARYRRALAQLLSA
jgi:formiminoglutamate deiminase